MDKLEELLQDLRHAARMLRKNPGFTAVVVLALALGVGANTAIFSVVNGVLLKPLPYPEPERLVALWGTVTGLDYEVIGLTEGEIVEIARESETLADMAAYDIGTATLSGPEGDPDRILVAYTTPGLYPALRVTAERGRLFLPEEEERGNEHVALLSHGLWQRRYGSDPGVLGSTLRLDDESFKIVGILPASFLVPQDLEGPESVDLYVPMTLNRRDPKWISHSRQGIARLRPGATFEQAAAEVAAIARRIRQEHAMFYPANVGLGIATGPLHEKVVGDVRPVLMILMGAVALVLLIACANVANLLLARAEVRQKEVAVRTALGAGRWRLARQFLTESALYGLLGGGAGLLLAVWALQILRSSRLADLPRLGDVAIDPRVLLFTLAVSLVAAAVAGFAPALQVSRADLGTLLKEEGRGSSAGRRGQLFRRGLVVLEVAVAVVLVIASGLLIRSFVHLQKVELGFDTEDLLTMRVSLPPSKYENGPPVVDFYRRAMERLAALPGVTAVTAANNVPLGPGSSDTIFDIEGRPSALENPAAFGDNFPNAFFRIVSPGYFETMHISAVSGRLFSRSDAAGAPGVIVINETLARRFWPGQNPVGRRMRLYRSESEKGAWLTVAGVVADAKIAAVREDPKPEMYLPLPQFHVSLGFPAHDMTLLLRTASAPEGVAEAAKSALREIERDLAFSRLRSMDDLVADSVARPRFNMLLITVFAGLALALAMIGVYGLLSYSVARRMHEMGIRFALGARARDVLGLVVLQGMGLALLGLAAGLALALAATRVLVSFLFGVGTFDAAVYAQVAAVLAAVAFLACYLPARRAARVDPMVALKPE